MTYGHLQADCLYTGISSGPNARCRVWEAFTFFYYLLTYFVNIRQGQCLSGPLQRQTPVDLGYGQVKVTRSEYIILHDKPC